jgi:nicotinamide-nucleotide amidase
MSRETFVPHKIAILATGDEICQGDILNTNCQEIAVRLVNAGMSPNLHAAVPDIIEEMEKVMRFLLGAHQALIITGGLGPTSDDLTRFALSKCIDRELIFDNPTWDVICARLRKFGYAEPPDSNRQQALFPADAKIIPNPNGTAAGCYVTVGEQYIFMLPGPPFECLPMVDEVIVPTLTAAGFSRLALRKKWLLFGVSESQIAEELDKLAKPFDCVTGYRLWYPYIECKLYSNNEKDFNALVPLIEQAIKPYLLGNGTEAASQMLTKKLVTANIKLGINDRATGGALQRALLQPETNAFLLFDDQTIMPRVEISGLMEYWQSQPDKTQCELSMTFVTAEKSVTKSFTLPFRGKRVIAYAVEFICEQVTQFLH